MNLAKFEIHPWHLFLKTLAPQRLLYSEFDGGVPDVPVPTTEKVDETLQSIDSPKAAEAMCIAKVEATKEKGSEVLGSFEKGMDEGQVASPEAEPELAKLLTQEEINAVRDALLPDTNINQTVKYFTGQKNLEGYQRVLLAPANAFEGLLTGIAGLPDTVDAMFKAASDADTSALDAAGKLVWDVFMNHMSMAEKAAIGVQLTGEAITGAGLVNLASKISKSATVMGIMARIGNALPKFQKAGKAGLITRVGEKAIGVAKTVQGSKLGKLAVETAQKPMVKTAYKVGSEGRDIAKSAREKGDKAKKALVEMDKREADKKKA